MFEELPHPFAHLFYSTDYGTIIADNCYSLPKIMEMNGQEFQPPEYVILVNLRPKTIG